MSTHTHIHTQIREDPSTVRNWISHFHKHAQLEDDVLLITVIYFERLVSTRAIALTGKTFRAVILTSLLIASKIWDDVSMENGDFAAIADWPLHKVNELEVLALEALDWRCTVTAGEYTTYFFKLRSVIGTMSFYSKHSSLYIHPSLINMSTMTTTYIYIGTWGVLGKMEKEEGKMNDDDDDDRSTEGKTGERRERRTRRVTWSEAKMVDSSSSDEEEPSFACVKTL